MSKQTDPRRDPELYEFAEAATRLIFAWEDQDTKAFRAVVDEVQEVRGGLLQLLVAFSSMSRDLLAAMNGEEQWRSVLETAHERLKFDQMMLRAGVKGEGR